MKTQDDNPKSLVSIHYVAIVFGFALPTNAWTETDMSEHDKHMLLRVFRTHPVQVWAFLWKVRWAFVVRRWPWLGKRLRGLEAIFVVEPGGGKCHPPTASGRRNLSVIESRRRPSYLSAWPDEQEEEALGLRSREANNSLCDHRPPTQQKHVLMT